MHIKSIEATVFKIISEGLNIDIKKISPNSALVADLGADSLDHIELCMSVEDEFGFILSDEEIEKISTVQNILDLVISKIS